MMRSGLHMNRFKKRERTQNWAYEEKRFLLDLCRKDMKIIENKRLDSALTALKNRAWRIIHQQFTSTFGTDRNCNRLKEQWRRMKACTRAEIMDYHHRVTRYGQDVADRKRPSQFTFEIWEFMQEAKRACKSEAMDDVDYSKMQLSLERNLPDEVMVEDDEIHWDKSSQNICEVQIKEESLSENEKNDSTSTPNLRQHSDGQQQQQQHSKQTSVRLNSISNQKHQQEYFYKNDDSMPSLSINNVAASLDTLNMIKNQINNQQRDRTEFTNNDQAANLKPFVDMQMREHVMRMEILQLQLETAKFNRDTAELNMTLALRKLNETNRGENQS